MVVFGGIASMVLRAFNLDRIAILIGLMLPVCVAMMILLLGWGFAGGEYQVFGWIWWVLVVASSPRGLIFVPCYALLGGLFGVLGKDITLPVLLLTPLCAWQAHAWSVWWRGRNEDERLSSDRCLRCGYALGRPGGGACSACPECGLAANRCTRCGYLLDSSPPGPCPECGESGFVGGEKPVAAEGSARSKAGVSQQE